MSWELQLAALDPVGDPAQQLLGLELGAEALQYVVGISQAAFCFVAAVTFSRRTIFVRQPVSFPVLDTFLGFLPRLVMAVPRFLRAGEGGAEVLILILQRPHGSPMRL